MFRCGSWLTYLPRELVLMWVFGFWSRGCWLSCLLSLPCHWFYRQPGKKIWKMFSLSINEHQIILQCALVRALWQVGSQRQSQIKQRWWLWRGGSFRHGGKKLFQSSWWNDAIFKFSHILVRDESFCSLAWYIFSSRAPFLAKYLSFGYFAL